jgi:hypothetical protein
MSASRPRPWHRTSIFGDGPRRCLDREQRAQFKSKLKLQRRPGRLTIAAAEVGKVLVDMLGSDGRLDPSHETLAARAAVHVETVRRALDQLHQFGFVALIIRRIARFGSAVRQVSNAYALAVPAAASFDASFLNQSKPTPPAKCWSAHTEQPWIPAAPEERAAAQAALAAVIERRRPCLRLSLAGG